MRGSLWAAVGCHRRAIRKPFWKLAYSFHFFSLRPAAGCMPHPNQLVLSSRRGSCSEKQNRWKGICHIRRKVCETELVSKNPYGHAIAFCILKFSLRLHLQIARAHASPTVT